VDPLLDAPDLNVRGAGGTGERRERDSEDRAVVAQRVTHGTNAVSRIREGPHRTAVCIDDDDLVRTVHPRDPTGVARDGRRFGWQRERRTLARPRQQVERRAQDRVRGERALAAPVQITDRLDGEQRRAGDALRLLLEHHAGLIRGADGSGDRCFSLCRCRRNDATGLGSIAFGHGVIPFAARAVALSFHGRGLTAQAIPRRRRRTRERSRVLCPHLLVARHHAAPRHEPRGRENEHRHHRRSHGEEAAHPRLLAHEPRGVDDARHDCLRWRVFQLANHVRARQVLPLRLRIGHVQTEVDRHDGTIAPREGPDLLPDRP
jgi:hypothetical protein